MQSLKAKLRWIGVQSIGCAIGLPLGLLLSVGAVLSPFTTFKQKHRRGAVVQDPVPGLIHEYVPVNGIRLHLVRTTSQPGSSSSPNSCPPSRLLLLLHGFPEGWFSWRHQLGSLGGGGCVVAALDMRGYGDSDKPQGASQYRMSKLVADVVGVIRALAPAGEVGGGGGRTQVCLCGHDWGGIVAWHVAHAHPQLVHKLAIVAAPHPLRFRLGECSWEQLARCWYIFVFQLPWLPELMLRAGDFSAFGSMFTEGPTACKREGAVGTEDIERYKIAFSRPGALTAAINYYRSLAAEATWQPDPHMQAALARPLPMPVLLMWADGDAVLRPGLLRGTELHAPRLRVHTLLDCSHWAQQDRWEEVNRLLREFMAEHG